jgi:hypothetical protein
MNAPVKTAASVFIVLLPVNRCLLLSWQQQC